MAWAGDSHGYIDTVINLGPNLAGQTVTLRFRFGSDEAVAAPGWRIDTITIRDGVCPTATPTPSLFPPTPTPSPSPAQTLNLSTRMLVLNLGIGGFIITGTEPKQVVLRGIGPSLSMVGVPNPLADPILELHGPSGFTTITNDNWMDDPVQKALITATGLAPTNNLESAIIATLSPGAYTGVLRGKNNGIGVALIEVYDVGQAANSMLGNISTRAFVSTGSDVVIDGFILGGGTNNTNVLIRGLGPSLCNLGIPNCLADPILEFHDSNGGLLTPNGNCSLPPPDPREPCIEMSLGPGAYTTILASSSGGTGVGLIEIYNLQ